MSATLLADVLRNQQANVADQHPGDAALLEAWLSRPVSERTDPH